MFSSFFGPPQEIKQASASNGQKEPPLKETKAEINATEVKVSDAK